MNTYAHVSYNQTWPEGHDLYVVHGTSREPRPRRINTPMLRYIQAAGKHKDALTTTTAARAWAKETFDNGWDGIYLDVMDWRSADDIKLARAIRAAVGPDYFFIVNGHPFHVADLSRKQTLVDKALIIADGFQLEGARLGQAAKVLPKYPNTQILWLVFGDIDDTKYRQEFERFANPYNHYYGRRISKVPGDPQDPR